MLQWWTKKSALDVHSSWEHSTIVLKQKKQEASLLIISDISDTVFLSTPCKKSIVLVP